ncbi:MAG: WYL domain-containing protein [Thermoguttaceae bacterium]|nr:WYL domain-containing protein [Thermoguttaceae bacterium]
MNDDNAFSRQWQITQLLACGQETTCQELADEFEVSARTIQRDLKFLVSVGVPLREMSVSPQGKKAWMMEDTGKIDFSYDEVSALYLLKPHLKPLGGTSIGKAAARALKKIEKRLGPGWIPHLESLLEIFNVKKGESQKQESTGKVSVLETLINGCQDRCEVRITYRSNISKTQETYSIQPYQLACSGGTFYVRGYSCKRQADCEWKLDRMIAAELTRKKFERRENFEFEPFADGHTKTKIVVRFAPSVARYVHERHWHESEQLTENADGSLLVKYVLPETVRIKSYILSFGPFAEIIEPALLRQELKEEIESMRKLYQ